MTQNEKWMDRYDREIGCFDFNTEKPVAWNGKDFASGNDLIKHFISEVESSTVDRVRREEREKAAELVKTNKLLEVGFNPKDLYWKQYLNRKYEDIAQAILKG